jgi:uncharacterized protein (TIRG00374 family)
VSKKFSENINLSHNKGLILTVSLSIVFLLIGQWLRMLRTKIIINQVRAGDAKGQFASLSVGYLINALTPFRIGEIVRSYLISSRLQISFLYTFAAVVIERCIDVIFICIVALLIAVTISTNITTIIFFSALSGLTIAVLLLLALWLLAKENKTILRLIWFLTSLLNKELQNSLRFKVWSLIYGLQRFTANKTAVLNYILLAIISWASLLISTGIIAYYYFRSSNISQIGVLLSEPYIAVTSLMGAIGVDVYIENATSVLSSFISPQNAKEYLITVWFVLIVPMALIGLASVFIFKWKKQKRLKPTSSLNEFSNKLSRQFDLSQEFPVFLDSYFKNDSLTKILHKIEIDGKVSLVKFFKGGSDALTMLAMKNDELFVKKIVIPEFASRLKLQYNWLNTHKNKSIVKTLREEETSMYYAIDLEYSPSNISLFEYIHTHNLAQSKSMVEEVWEVACKTIYKNLTKEKKHVKEIKQYINERLIKKVEFAAKINLDLKNALESEKIYINGELYDNLYTVIDKIKNNKNAWNDIETYRESAAVHGDLTIDNILVDTKLDTPYIIDPSDDNQVRGPVIDFGRQMQSLSYGYEFLCNEDNPIKLNDHNNLPSIKFNDHRSARYMQLDSYTKEYIMPKYLTQREMKSVEFHVGLFYARMLAHRVIINPSNVLQFYGTAVVSLNKFLEQYKK